MVWKRPNLWSALKAHCIPRSYDALRTAISDVEFDISDTYIVIIAQSTTLRSVSKTATLNCGKLNSKAPDAPAISSTDVVCTMLTPVLGSLYANGSPEGLVKTVSDALLAGSTPWNCTDTDMLPPSVVLYTAPFHTRAPPRASSMPAAQKRGEYEELLVVGSLLRLHVVCQSFSWCVKRRPHD